MGAERVLKGSSSRDHPNHKLRSLETKASPFSRACINHFTFMVVLTNRMESYLTFLMRNGVRDDYFSLKTTGIV